MNTCDTYSRKTRGPALRFRASVSFTSLPFPGSCSHLLFSLWTIVFVLGAVTGKHATAQTTVGIQPLGSYANGGIDQVNLGNLGVHIDIPLFQHKGRGTGMGTNVHLVYDSSYTAGLSPVSDMGWRVVVGTAVPGIVIAHQDSSDFEGLPCKTGGTTCNAGFTNYSYSFAFVDSTGYTHPFTNIATSRQCRGVSSEPCSDINLNAGGDSSDGSGYFLSVNPVTPSPLPSQLTVTTPSGIVYNYPQYGVADANGNVGVSTASQGGYWVNWNTTLADDSGVSATITGGAYSSSDSTKWTSRAPLQVQYHDTSGNLQTVTVNYSLHSVNINCAPAGTNFSATIGLADSVVYPDGSNYQFTYQPDGQLASMRLPTGGTITYNTGSQCVTASSGGYVGIPASVSRSNPDGSTTYAQTATPVAPYSPYSATSATHVAKPDGSSEQINFVYVLSNSEAAGNVNYNYETAHTWTSASGSVLKSTMNCYNGATGDCTTTPVTLPITQITTTTTLGGVTSKTVEYMNTAGLDTEVDEYDFGASSPTRKTITAYAPLGNNIADRPSSVTVSDTNGVVASQVTYGYDEFNLTSTTSLQGHNTISGARGNRTSQHSWLNTTGGTLDSHWQYDDAGQALAIEDPRTNWTYYAYDTATDNCAINTTFPLPSIATSQVCDPGTGLVSSATDSNGTKTTYSYDGMLRRIAIVATNGNGMAADTAYGYSGASLPETITTTVSATPSPSQVSTTTLDGLGRVVTSVGPNNAIVSTTYDSMGRPHSVSSPYFNTSDPTYDLTTYAYDTLGRKLSQTQSDTSSQLWNYIGNQTTFTDQNGLSWVRTSDALGRLTNVIEPTGSSTTYSYDVLDNLRTVTQQGVSGDTARTHNFVYDSLSRLVSASNPETGTIGYGYDANGNLTSKTDARGISTSYSYDALNRVLSKTYSNDPSATPSTCYQYDTSINGRGANLIGRLTSSWTQPGSCPAAVPLTGAITRHSILAYDAMGRVLSEQQCQWSNCTSGTPYATRTSYNLAGQQLSYGNAVQAFDLTNFYDSAGRLQHLDSSWSDSMHPALLFSGGTYTPSGAIQSMTLGTGVTVTKTYDSRQRITSSTANQVQ
jgi:YD repeat-containing protein